MNRVKNITMILFLIAALAGVAANQQAVNQNREGLQALTGHVEYLELRDTLQKEQLCRLEWTLDLSVLDSCGIITNGYGHGSCVAIGPDLVLTAGHCIGYKGGWIEIGGIKYDILDEWKSEQYDVGFVRIDGTLPYLQLGEMPQLLDTVYFVGAPIDVELVNMITKGIVSKLDINGLGDWAGVMIVDAFGNSGSSGCALLNQQGQIIGIAVGGYGNTTPELCEPISHIREALEEYNAAH